MPKPSRTVHPHKFCDVGSRENVKFTRETQIPAWTNKIFLKFFLVIVAQWSLPKCLCTGFAVENSKALLITNCSQCLSFNRISTVGATKNSSWQFRADKTEEKFTWILTGNRSSQITALTNAQVGNIRTFILVTLGASKWRFVAPPSQELIPVDLALNRQMAPLNGYGQREIIRR